MDAPDTGRGAWDETWIYLCTADDLAIHTAFVTTRIGRVPVLAHNLKGRIAAFRNVCSHRFAVIHAEPQGCGPLRCPYHGWTFDAEGMPIGIPFNRSDFGGLDEAERRRLALSAVALERCGHLCFVRLSPDRGPSLAEALGGRFAEITALCDAFPAPLAEPTAGSTPDDRWTRFHVAPNLTVSVLPGEALVLDGAPPPGADARFARRKVYRRAVA